LWYAGRASGLSQLSARWGPVLAISKYGSVGRAQNGLFSLRILLKPLTVVTTVLVLDRPQQHEFQRLSCLEKFAGVFVAADPNSFTKISLELGQPFGTTPA
jgi:hypothetical protein